MDSSPSQRQPGAHSSGPIKSYSPASSPDIHRTLPHSMEAEQGVLGSMLLAPIEVIPECILRISAAYFYQPIHALIYEILVECWTAERPADVVTLTQILRDRNKLETVGGPPFITHLFTFTPTAANSPWYIEIVEEKYTLREIISACTAAAARAYDEQGEVNPLLDEVEAKIMAISEKRASKAKLPVMRDQVMEAIESIEKMYERKGAITGLASGFKEFDNLTDGLHASEMIVIAARPSMGKTAWAMNVAEHVTLIQNKPVGIFSLEMSSQQLVQRLLCSRARVNMQKVRNGLLSERDFPNLMNAASKLAEAKMFIDDTAGLSILELRAKARRMKQKDGIELIIIDYLQLLRSTSKRAQNDRQIEITEISSGLKALTKELKIPIIVLAQLNRKPEERAGGRPKLSDLRESGSIEQDADLVGLLLRSEYYAETEDEKEDVKGEAELIIAKQRNGPIGDVKLTFLKEYARFEDRAPESKGE